jgi:hypothetical protein
MKRELGMKWSGHISRYNTSICLEGLRRIRKTLGRRPGLRVKIRNWDLPQTKLGYKPFQNDAFLTSAHKVECRELPDAAVGASDDGHLAVQPRRTLTASIREPHLSIRGEKEIRYMQSAILTSIRGTSIPAILV